MKLGVIEDSTNRSKFADLLRFHTSLHPDGWRLLGVYVRHMRHQKAIYFIIGKKCEQVNKSLCMEEFDQRSIEVIFRPKYT